MIVLTGASGGIGEKLLTPLSKFDEIVGIYNKTIPNNDENVKVIFAKVDIKSSDSIALFVKKHKKILKDITLINCAVSKIDNLLVNFEEKDFDKIIDTNIKGNFLLTKSLLPIMIENNWG